MAINQRKKDFAKAREAGANQEEAALDAGYSANHAEKAGSRLDADPDVIRYRETLRADPGDTEAVDDPEVFLMRVMNDPMEDTKTRMNAAVELQKMRAAGGGSKSPEKLGKKDQQHKDAEDLIEGGTFAPAAPPKLQAVK